MFVRSAKLVDVWLLRSRPGQLDHGACAVRLHVETFLAAEIEGIFQLAHTHIRNAHNNYVMGKRPITITSLANSRHTALLYSSCCCTQCIWISPHITALYKRALVRQNHYLSRLCASILLFWLEEHTTAIFSFALIFLLTYTETSQHTEYVHIQSLYDSRGQQFFQGLLKTLPEVVGELWGQVSRPNSRYSPISGTRRPCSIPRRGSRSVSASFGESVYTTLHLPSCVYVAVVSSNYPKLGT